jgi:hypothetical protein
LAGRTGGQSHYGREVLEYDIQEHAGPAVRQVMIGSRTGFDRSAGCAASIDPLPSDASAGTDAAWRPAAVLHSQGGEDRICRGAGGFEAEQNECGTFSCCPTGPAVSGQICRTISKGSYWTRVTHRLQPESVG